MGIENRKDARTGARVCENVKHRENLRRARDDYRGRARSFPAKSFETSTVLIDMIGISSSDEIKGNGTSVIL